MADKKNKQFQLTGAEQDSISALSGQISGIGVLANSGMGSGSPQSGSPVYLGQPYGGTPVGVMGGYQGASSYGVGVLKDTSTGATPYGQAVLAPTQWNNSQLANFVNTGLINKIPGFDVGMGMPEIQGMWQKMVDASVMYNQNLKQGQKPWSPWDVMNTYGDNKKGFGTVRKGDWEYDVATGERMKYVGPRSRTSTSKHVDLSSPEQVQAIATQALRELLGRAPTDKELAQFRSSINAKERSTPEVTTTTQTLSDQDIANAQASGGSVWDTASQSSTTSGGVDDTVRAALIANPTEKTKEYGKYQAATTYWDAMMQMIAGG